MIDSDGRLHADAGDLPRDPRRTTAAARRGLRGRHRHHALAQSARGRRHQVQPADRRPGRHRRHRAGSRTGPTSCCRAISTRVGANRVRAGARRADDARLRLCRLVRERPRVASSTWTSSGAPGSGSASIRSAARASRYWAPIAERYGIDIEVVNDDGRSDVPLHAARLGRQDPHGLLVALRDGQADRAQGPLRHRLRQRSRRRPPRHRHAAAPA